MEGCLLAPLMCFVFKQLGDTCGGVFAFDAYFDFDSDPHDEFEEYFTDLPSDVFGFDDGDETTAVVLMLLLLVLLVLRECRRHFLKL